MVLVLQDFLCGIRGKDFVMVCSDTSAVQSIVMMKQVGTKGVVLGGGAWCQRAGCACQREEEPC